MERQQTAGGVVYPRQSSMLLPRLHKAQLEHGNVLTAPVMKGVAEELGQTPSKVYGVATYYTMFNTRPVGKYHIQVDTNIPALLAGADSVLAHLEDRLGIRPGETTSDGLFTLTEVEDLGSCGTCPVVQVNDTYYESMTKDKIDLLLASLRKGVLPPREDASRFGSQCGILLKNRGVPDAVKIDVYKKGGGYQGWEKARQMQPAEIIELVKQAALRGRGGAGFPAGLKWGFLPRNDSRPVYLICNADEGEPGTFKDRQIMQYDPHLLVEGIAIASRAVGAALAFIYIRGEFGWIADILEQAIASARTIGLLDTEIIVHRGAGSYVCGEETALIESLEGGRGNPRIKPPFPANKGLYDCPTVVNNVETLACLPYIITHGAEAFRSIGTTGNSGPKLFGVSGHVNKPGVYEYPLGTPLTTVLEAAGGVKGTMKAVIVGGLSVPILTAQESVDLLLDYDDCAKHGTMLGSGGIIVMNESVSIPKIARRAIHFYAHESCGQCTPCREGSITIARLLDSIVGGVGTVSDIDTIESMCRTIIGSTLCPTGDAFAMPIGAMIKKFRNEFVTLVK